MIRQQRNISEFFMKTQMHSSSETAWSMNRIKRQIIIPELRVKKNRIGNFFYVPISLVESEELYKKRSDILALFDKGLLFLMCNYRKSDYYRQKIYKYKKSRAWTFYRILKYYTLFQSVKTRGFKTDPTDLLSFPWLFVSQSIVSRFDGHHRASVARYLGYKELPVLLITPKDVLRIKDLPAEVLVFFQDLNEPELDKFKPYPLASK